MANGLPYYSAYPIDFIGGCLGMPLEVKGAYRIILDMIYMHGGELEDDPQYIAGHLGCSVRKWKSIKLTLETWHEKRDCTPKIVCENGIIFNSRARVELEKTRKYQRTQSENRRCSNKNKDLEKPSINPRARSLDTDTDTKKDNPPIVPPEGKLDLAPEKETDDGRKRQKRGSRLSPDWQPDATDIEYARSKGFSDEHITDLADRFRDYWTDLAGAKAVKLDWHGTWRNKCRSEASTTGRDNRKGTGRSSGNQHGPASWSKAGDNVLAAIERAAAREGNNSYPEGFEGEDSSEIGRHGRHGDSLHGLCGGTDTVPGGHSSACIEGTAEEIEVVPVVVRTGGRA